MEPRFRSLSPEELVSRQQALRTLARRVLANDHDADDAVQEAWLAALREPEARVRNLDAWMTSVVRYQASRARRRKLRREVHEREAATRSTSIDEIAPVAAAGDIERLVQRLPEPYRTVVWLRYFDDASVEEISAGLERPLNTVKSQLRRAHELLRAMLDGEATVERRAWRRSIVLLAGWSRAVPAPTGVRPRPVAAAAAAAGLVVAAALAIHTIWPAARAVETAVASEASRAAATRTAAVDPGVASLARTALVEPGVAAPSRAPSALRGVVIDEEGAPVPAAAILLSAPDRLDAWSEVARSDAQGWFALDEVDPRAWVCADPPVGSPSNWNLLGPLIRLRASEGIELHVRTQRLPLRGFVVDPRGAAVADATIELFPSEYLGAMWNEAGTWETRPPSFTATSDAAGTFAIDPVERRDVLVVRAAGYAPWFGRAKLDEPTIVPLAASIDLLGEVRYAGGALVPGGVVRVEQDWPMPPVLLGVDAGGRFRSRDIAAGRITVRAQDASGRSAVVSAVARSGESLSVALELEEAATIRGVARDHAGRPLVGWRVFVMDHEAVEGSYFPAAIMRDAIDSAFTAGDGSFAFPARDASEHVVWLAATDDPRAAPFAWRRGVRPGEAITLITADDSKPAGHIGGVITCAPAGTCVVARALAVGFTAESDVDPNTGRYDLGPLPPMEYDVSVQAPGHEPTRIAQVVLGVHQDLDLGCLPIPERGELALMIGSEGGGQLPKDLRVVIRSAARRFQISPACEDLVKGITSLGPLALEPGTYGVRVLTEGCAEIYRNVDVTAGRRVELHLTLQRGTPVNIALILPRALSPRGHIDLRWRSLQTGETMVYERAWPRSRDQSGAPQFAPLLPPGDWIVEAFAGGYRGEAEVHVTPEKNDRFTNITLKAR